MKKRLLSIAASLALICAFATATSAIETQAAQSSDFDCVYATETKPDANYVAYGGTATLLTADEAAAQNIPTGYTGDVLVMDGNSRNRGVMLDFSTSKIAIGLLDSITFRVYVGSDGAADNYPEVRIVKPGTGALDWIMRYNLPEKGEEDKWIDITLDANGGNFFNKSDFTMLAENGILNKFELSVRVNAAKVPFYLDSVSVKVKEDDGVAPVIDYTGEESISVYEGAKLYINATAYDEQEQSEKPIEYVWKNEKGETVTVETGKTPEQGNYTLTLIAVDTFGNVAEKTLSVEVKEADTIPPEIFLNTDTVYALTGTLPYLNIEMTDNGGEVKKTMTWSDGALDLAGKLTEGTHTLTLRAEDPSGNVTQKIVTVYVLSTEPEDDVVVDEEALTPIKPEIPDDSGSEDSTPDESTSSEDSSVEDSSLEDSSVEDSSVEDSSVEDSSVEDSDNEPTQSSILEEEKPGKGCGNVVGGGLAALAVCGAAIIVKKKKE